MPKDKTKKAIYDIAYNKENTIVKHVSFNRKVKEDMELLEWVEAQPMSKNAYFKKLAREDMESQRDV